MCRPTAQGAVCPMNVVFDRLALVGESCLWLALPHPWPQENGWDLHRVFFRHTTQAAPSEGSTLGFWGVKGYFPTRSCL